MPSYTIHDILGSSLAFFLFPLIYVIPGYTTAWLFDLFDFRKRLQATRFVIAIVISIGISPVITFLTWNLASIKATFLALFAFALAFIIIFIKTRQHALPNKTRKFKLLALSIAAGWIILSILSLVDIQWGDRLYYSVVAGDFTTRVAVINAMTRSGVPPINPSYFPGHPVRLTYLYYFWYIPCSLVDQLGGSFVDGRDAMIASVAWCGLALMAVIALYFRLRNPTDGPKAWKTALLGSSLLLISGLDFIPALLLMIATRIINSAAVLNGDIEHWNEQITAWIGALLWVPHHVAAAIACIVGMLLVHDARDKSFLRQVEIMVIAGLAFASAFGLSVYVTIVFAVFWGIWLVVLFFQKKRSLSLAMMLAGIIALAAVSPFLLGVLSGGASSDRKLPIAFAVRAFWPVIYGGLRIPPALSNEIFFLLLPLNYLLELGFFFIVGLYWAQQNDKGKWKNNAFHLAEVILLGVTVFITSFFRSTAIGANDLGWRAWLFGQFILLIWATDVILYIVPDLKTKELLTAPLPEQKMWRTLRLLLVLGLITTIVDITLLRTWPMLVDAGVAGFPNGFSTDRQLGARTLAAREAYDFINSNTQTNIHIQQNPQDLLNRPVGLYANRPIAISGQTAYGISPEELQSRADQIIKIFESETTWNEIDSSCKSNFIDIIVVNDEDALWKYLPNLEKERNSLFQNRFYAVFSCGSLIKP